MNTEQASPAPTVSSERLLADFAGYVLTCRRTNQRDWMQGLAEHINTVAEALGDPTRYKYDGRDFIVKANTKADRREA